MILGVFAGCCATINSLDYGKDVTRFSTLANDVQNLVVRDTTGEIIGMGTLYVDKSGVIVINSFDLNQKYRKHEKINVHADGTFSGTRDNIGRYNVLPEHQEGQTRDRIFNAFQRGIGAFVHEYDSQNPKTINQVRVGWIYNHLKRQVEQFKEVEYKIIVPEEYSFEDAGKAQYILYDRENFCAKRKEVSRNELKNPRPKDGELPLAPHRGAGPCPQRGRAPKLCHLHLLVNQS